MLDRETRAEASGRRSVPGVGPHCLAKAKRVVQIFCAGGVSHIDTFDYKADLARFRNLELSLCQLQGWVPTPARQRAALVLTELLDFSAEEAGRLLGVQASTIRSLARNARESARRAEVSDA